MQESMTSPLLVDGMSRAGKVWDNSAMESFLSSMKAEPHSQEGIPARSREQARVHGFDRIGRFYNPMRRH